MTAFLRPVPAEIYVGAWLPVLVTSIVPGEQPGTMRVETVSDGPWNVDAKGLRCDHEAARAAMRKALETKIAAKVGGILRGIADETERLVRGKP